MAHPFHQHREHRVAKERAHKIAGGRLAYASGGGVYTEGSEKKALKHIHALEKHEHEEIQHERKHHSAHHSAGGKRSKARLDRKHRAAGGACETGERMGRATGGPAHRRHPKKGHVTTNVIVNGGGGAQPPRPVPVPVPSGPPPAAARPPMPAGPPPGAPPAGGGMPPGAPPPGLAARPPLPGMPPRKRGGRVSDGPGWTEGEKNKTKVQHTDGKRTDSHPVGRARGGAAAHGTSHAIAPIMKGKDNASRAVKPAMSLETVSRDVRPAKPLEVGDGRKMSGGAKSGVERLAKAHAAHAGNAP